MKYIKTYEQIESDPEVGDYVYCEIEDNNYNPSNFIGKVMIISKVRQTYRVKYPANLPDDPDDKYRVVYRTEIIDFSKNLIDLEKYENSIKYNL